jgi:hypothetical protein
MKYRVLCSYTGCKLRPTYGLISNMKARFCKEHKSAEMVDVANPKCIEEGCITRPIYNIDGEIRALYCKRHKKDNMINIKDKNRCIEQGCKKFKTFNYFGEKRPLYCSSHKKENMVNVITKSCIQEGCNKVPIYNYKGNNKALYCNQHKKDHMINIKDKTCSQDDCKTRANFTFLDNQEYRFCSKHKKEGMLDIKKPKCANEGCNIRPSFNLPSEKNPHYCVTHKLAGMVDINNPKCLSLGCGKQPSYGIEKPIYCSEHKTPKCNLLKQKPPCKTPLCGYLAKYKENSGYCFRCYVYMFPEKSNVRNYKTKERAVVDYVMENFKEYSIITDKKILDGCSRRRPDILLDFGDQVIIIEVDENQHDNYDCSCENKRLMEISQDIGYRPLVFIRFNPDKYINIHGSIIPSCWTTSNNKGLPVVSKRRKVDWDNRLISLKEQIQYWIDNRTDKTLEVVQLFYDMN